MFQARSTGSFFDRGLLPFNVVRLILGPAELGDLHRLSYMNLGWSSFLRSDEAVPAWLTVTHPSSMLKSVGKTSGQHHQLLVNKLCLFIARQVRAEAIEFNLFPRQSSGTEGATSTSIRSEIDPPLDQIAHFIASVRPNGSACSMDGSQLSSRINQPYANSTNTPSATSRS